VLAGELANQQGNRRRAQRILEDAWRAEPHPDLARAYARLIETETPDQRLERVEVRLKPLRPDHPELHVAVGELAIAAGRHGRAREALERALALEPTQRVYRLLAELERVAGTPTRAQDWLQRAADAQPDRAWVCEDTGEVVPAWRPLGNSGRFDVVRWTRPPQVSTMLGSEHGPFLVADGSPPPPPESPRHEDYRRGGNGRADAATMATTGTVTTTTTTTVHGQADHDAEDVARPTRSLGDDDDGPRVVVVDDEDPKAATTATRQPRPAAATPTSSSSAPNPETATVG
jgi:HemY protein